MAELMLRDVPDDELDAITSRAERFGRTPEAEVRQLIHQAAQEEMLLHAIDRATKAVDAQLKGAERVLTPESKPRRRYRRVEPTRGQPRP